MIEKKTTISNNDEYHRFLAEKKVKITESGFAIDKDELNPLLFPFQKHCVQRALKCGGK